MLLSGSFSYHSGIFCFISWGPGSWGLQSAFLEGAFSALDIIMPHDLSPWITWLPVNMQLTEFSKAATRSFNLSGMILHAVSFICLQVRSCSVYFIIQKLPQML